MDLVFGNTVPGGLISALRSVIIMVTFTIILTVALLSIACDTRENFASFGNTLRRCSSGSSSSGTLSDGSPELRCGYLYIIVCACPPHAVPVQMPPSVRDPLHAEGPASFRPSAVVSDRSSHMVDFL